MDNNKISPLDCLKDLIDNTPLLDEEGWHDARSTGLGGSDTPKLMGLSPWGGQASVYADKVNGASAPGNISMDRGNYLEPLVIKEFEKQTDFEIIYVSEYEHCNLSGEILAKYERVFTDPFYPFIKATPDALLWDEKRQMIGVLEIKTSAGYGTAKWYDGVPDMYEVQLQKYMMVIKYLLNEVYGIEVEVFGYIAYMLDDKYEHTPEYKEDPQIWTIIEKADVEFWEKHIEKLNPPEPSTLDEAKALYREIKDKNVKLADLDIVNIIIKLDEKKQQLKEKYAPTNQLKEEIERLQLDIIKELQEYSELKYEDTLIATYKTDKKGNRRLVPKYSNAKKIMNKLTKWTDSKPHSQ